MQLRIAAGLARNVAAFGIVVHHSCSERNGAFARAPAEQSKANAGLMLFKKAERRTRAEPYQPYLPRTMPKRASPVRLYIVLAQDPPKMQSPACKKWHSTDP